MSNFKAREVSAAIEAARAVKSVALGVDSGVTLLCSDCNSYRAERDDARRELEDKLGAMREELELCREAMSTMVSAEDHRSVKALLTFQIERADSNWQELQTARALAQTLRAELDKLGRGTASTSGPWGGPIDPMATAARLQKARDERLRLIANIIENQADDEGELALLCGVLREELDS